MSALYKLQTPRQFSYRMDGMEPYELKLEPGHHKTKAFGMVLGIVASAATMGAAAPLLSAGGLTALSGGVMMAGGVLTGVGAITGNAKLAKIGGILSLAGGIGAYASGGFSSVSSVASPANAASSSSVMGQEAVAGIAADGAASASSALNTFGNNVASLMPAGTPMPGQLFTDGVLGSTASAAANTGAVVADASTGLAVTNIGATAPASTLAGQSTGLLSKAVDTVKGVAGFASDNPELIKIGGQMMQSGFGPDQQGLIDAQSSLYNSQATGSDIKNEFAEQQLKNINSQVLMLNENDPQLQQKKAAATAAGIPYQIIPEIGKGGLQYTTNPQAPTPAYSQPASA